MYRQCLLWNDKHKTGCKISVLNGSCWVQDIFLNGILRKPWKIQTRHRPWPCTVKFRGLVRCCNTNPFVHSFLLRFVPGPWSPCSASCGPGTQTREVKCQVLLSFTNTEVDLPEEECGRDRPQRQRPCSLGPCGGARTGSTLGLQYPRIELYRWDYRGFSTCSASCATGEVWFLMWPHSGLTLSWKTRNIKIFL